MVFGLEPGDSATIALDIDGNSSIGLTTDGVLLIRSIFDLNGTSLIQGAIGSGSSRTSAQIQNYLNSLKTNGTLDIDGNGSVGLTTDGVLLIRAIFGLTGTSLIQGAIASDATRSAAEIESYLTGLLGN